MASVEKRSRDGHTSWLARWRDPDGRQRKRTFTRKTDAERYLTGVEHSVLAGAYVDPASGRVTVGEWGGQWLAGRVDLKPKTRASYESLWRTCVAPAWSTVPLARVEHSAVSAWLAGLAVRLSASRSRQAYGLLSQMLDDAVKDRRLSRNPAHGCDLPRLPQRDKRFLTHGQVERLAGQSGEYGPLVRLLSYTGLRWGEACALRVRRVDLLRGRIEVAESLSDVNGSLTFEAPKTHKRRSVPVPRFLRDDLAALMVGKGPDDLVFTSPQGEPLRSANFRRRVWDRAVREAGLDGLTPHDLRHTAASLAVASGANVKAVQRMLGHQSAAMTLDVYASLFGDDLDALAERLDAASASARVPLVCPEPVVVDLDAERASR